MALGLLEKPMLGEPQVSLRDYQEEAIEAVRAEFRKGVRSTLVVMATGLGKSVTLGGCARMAVEKGNRTLILVHRKGLVRQLVSTLDMWGIEAGVEGFGQRARAMMFEPDVVVAMVQTMHEKNLAKWERDHFGLVIIDECHHSSAETYLRILRHFGGARRLGMSVGPDSTVELFGGCFGGGFVGPIESAFGLCLRSGMPIRTEGGYEIIDLTGVMARGWEFGRFAWKRCKKIIRHVGDVPCREIRSMGSRLIVTDCHSVFRAIDGPAGRRVQYPRLVRPNPKTECVESSAINVGDILLGDDGGDWGERNAGRVNMIEFCLQHMANSRVSVVCDVKSVDRSVFKAMGISSKKIYAWREHGAIPIRDYVAMGDKAPVPANLRVEGSKSTIAPEINLCSWAYILGFYLGDGWVCKSDNSKKIAFAVEDSMADEIQDRLSSMEGVGWAVRRLPTPGASVEIGGNNIFLATVLERIFGKIACHEKFIPGEWIVSWPLEARKNLLLGMIHSDGCFNSSGRNRRRTVFTTTSIKLAKSLLSLLRSLGIAGGLHQRSTMSGGVVDGRLIRAKRVAYSIGWSSYEVPGNKPGPSYQGNRQRFWHDSLEFNECPVRSINVCESPCYVYDLEMDGHPSFVADGVLVHNTATSDRADETPIVGDGQVFETLAYEMTLWDGMTAPPPGPYLSRLRYVQCPVEIDLRDLSPKGDDYTDDDLAARLEPILEVLANAIKQEIGDRQTMVFLPRVKTAELMAAALQAIGIRAISCDADDPHRNKKEMDYANGEAQVMCNVGLYTEGTDYPETAAIVLCRPTKSRSLFSQMLGRGVRLKKKHKDCIAVDFGYLTAKHDLVKLTELVDRSDMDGSVLDIAQEMMAKDKGLDLVEAVERAEKVHKERVKQHIQIRERQIQYRKREYDPLDAYEALGIPFRGSKDKTADPATPRQVDALNKFGVQDAAYLSRTRASTLLDYAVSRAKGGLATVKQLHWLIANGVDPDAARRMTKQEASAYLDTVFSKRRA